MSAPTSSPSDASQVHFGVGLPPLRPSQARRDNDERNPGHPPHLPGPSPPSSYLDPLITADSGHGGQLPCNQQTSVTRNDAPERATAARSNLFSIPPKPSFTSDPRGGPLIAAMGGQIDTTQKRKAEDGLIDPRLYKTPKCDSAGFSSTGTTVGQLGQNEPAVGLANTVVGTRQPILAPGIAADNDFLKSASDALIGWQLDLHDGSDEESGSENIPWGPSRYHDKDDDEPRQGRRGRGRGRGARGRGVKRGPRKAAEPTGDVKYRLNMASNAYMDRRLDEAIEWVEDAIRINAEIYQAWTLLASFLEEKGDLKGSFAARVFSCHLQPKIVDGWLSCAETGIALRDILPQDEAGILEQVTVCYSAALRADINNQEARYGRAAIAVERGQIRTAAKDYLYLLEHGEYDVHALRSYAEMTILLASTGKGDFYRLESAIDWYYRAFAHYRASAVYDRHFIEWRDVNIFAVLLAYVEHTKDALYEVKSLARWLLGRPNDNFWDDWQDDDREWDVDNTRRIGFGDFEEGKYPESSYGAGLPLDLRTKLAVYRLKLGDLNEAQHHLNYLDPEGPNGGHILSNEPHLLADLASALYESDLRAMAVRFFEPLLSVPEVLDSAILLAAGRCYLDSGDKRQAEECFSAAIDADESNDEASIDARYELAKMYEAAREEQEAYILVNEALRLQQAHDEADEDYEDDMGGYPGSDDDAQYRPSASTARKARPRTQRAPRPPKQKAPRPLVPKPSGLDSNGNTIRRPRPRRKVFGRTEEVTLEEKRRAEELTAAWRIVHSTRGSVENDTQVGPSDVFLRAAKELVDDFRSCKGFYSWEKYLIHLGIDEDKQVYVSRNRNLIEMKERLSHNLNPYGPNTERQLGERTAVSYRGVSFSEWLDLFLEYAVSLAHYERFQESYQVCESARDAEVFAKNKEDMFLIHVTWAACALRARDEETCVAAARFLMRDRQFDSDPFRMFAALCRLCPSPASWYASGPVQKYMLRQIKLMDRALVSEGGEVSEEEESKTNSGRVYPSKELDVTLLVLYGHILFVSNSFTYALNYFLRAYSIDPENQMILLSVGQCYIHYALKRQSENRQYLLVQGFVFLHRYYDIKVSSTDAAERQEAHYNMARSYHAIGIPHLAAEFYQRVLRDIPDDSDASIFGKSDLSQEAAYNLQQICWAGGDMEAVKALNARYLTL
ncbi:putative transcription factor tau subunit sfc4 [Rosellinia necatrix]|uniref:Putative transcription factor tau subunit sfc4 n=1 Tax=Rosellinia necatrix TaxID=77044 RepID=A0A1W2TEV7_ROSNE|nr:putative transcription factor tau subunit sfc4 [Rosellinia necatrix]